MMQDLEKSKLFMEIQEKQLIMTGATVKKNQKKLSFEDVRKIKQQYRDMYFALTSINWAQGMTLGMAWQKAIRQIEAYIVSKVKTPNHPMNAELIKFHTDFRKDMSKYIMTSEYSDEKSKDALNNMYQQYMPEKVADKKQTAQSFENAKLRAKQMMQKIVMRNLNMIEQQRQHEFAA
jgi:hypothetical protein